MAHIRLFPKIFTIFMVAMTLLATMATPAAATDFTDSSGNEYEIAIQWAGTTGIARGYADGSFRPNEHVTRLEYATLLGRAMQVSPINGVNCFSDLSGYPAEMVGYACRLNSLRVINGYADGRFGPNDKVTLVQELSMLTRALQLRGCVPASGPDNGSYPNVQGGHRADLLAYLTRYGGQVNGAPNPSAPLPGAYDPVNRGRSVNLIMISYWNISQGFPC